jgi:hypothetical protein
MAKDGIDIAMQNKALPLREGLGSDATREPQIGEGPTLVNNEFTEILAFQAKDDIYNCRERFKIWIVCNS